MSTAWAFVRQINNDVYLYEVRLHDSELIGCFLCRDRKDVDIVIAEYKPELIFIFDVNGKTMGIGEKLMWLEWELFR